MFDSGSCFGSASQLTVGVVKPNKREAVYAMNCFTRGWVSNNIESFVTWEDQCYTTKEDLITLYKLALIIDSYCRENDPIKSKVYKVWPINFDDHRGNECRAVVDAYRRYLDSATPMKKAPEKSFRSWMCEEFLNVETNNRSTPYNVLIIFMIIAGLGIILGIGFIGYLVFVVLL